MIRAYSSWKSKIQYLKILEYFLRSIKKRICTTEMFKFFIVCSFLHSVLGQGSCNTNSSISEVWHGSDQPVAQPSARLDCWINCFSSFSWKYPIDSIWASRLACWQGQSSTVISWSANHLEVLLALYAGAKVLLEKEISICIKLVSR